ncbi:hypothetical protein DVH24_037872 [Malus domestica]|uniref:Uncharacterized protein n=1 Tax=Malus domestica TaxID=3750 RepID=A0A498K1Z9_MALDO|nr:hypothetical protein DVH24_037872 [Malus domestica]
MPRSLEGCHGRLLDEMVSRQRSSKSPQTSRCMLLLRMRPFLLSSPHRGFCPLITSFFRLYFSGSLSEFCAIVSDFLCVVLWWVSCSQSEAQWGVMANKNLEKLVSIDAQLQLLVPVKLIGFWVGCFAFFLSVKGGWICEFSGMPISSDQI